jgi:hypothetical protein
MVQVGSENIISVLNNHKDHKCTVLGLRITWFYFNKHLNLKLSIAKRNIN